MKKELFSNVLSLVWNLLLVYVCYTLSRLVFLCVNWDTFSEHLTFGYAMSLFGAGIIFDTTAILYSNALFILLFLFPLHWKETPVFYKIVRWVFTSVNTFPDNQSNRLCVFSFYRKTYYDDGFAGISE